MSANCTSESYTVSRLIKNREYQFRISAQNEFGVGPGLVSSPITVKVSYNIPDAPEQPVCVTADEDSITISYAPPLNDGGSLVTGYHVERKERKSSRWVKVTRDATLDLTFTVTELVHNNKYEFRVYAENAAGLSQPSEPSSYIICREPVCE